MLLGFQRRVTRFIFSQDNSVRLQLQKLVLALFILLTLHVVAMCAFENMPIEQALWLSLTTVTTVGYGDIAAQTVWGRVSTVILLYGGGIAILAQTVALYFEFRQEMREKILKGEWSWDMSDHLVFLNCPEEGWQDYFFHIVTQLRKSTVLERQRPIIIVSNIIKDGLPSKLRALDVVHVNAPPSDIDALKAANIFEAKTIVVLASHHLKTESDSINFDLTHRLREIGVKGTVIAEVVQDHNRSRLIDMGANHVIRPVRMYPEFLVRTILAPGSECVLEDLFNSTDEECVRYNINGKAIWKNIVRVMVDGDIGIPLALIGRDKKIMTNPMPELTVDIEALFVIVRCQNVRNEKEVQKLFDTLIAP